MRYTGRRFAAAACRVVLVHTWTKQALLYFIHLLGGHQSRHWSLAATFLHLENNDMIGLESVHALIWSHLVLQWKRSFMHLQALYVWSSWTTNV